MTHAGAVFVSLTVDVLMTYAEAFLKAALMQIIREAGVEVPTLPRPFLWTPPLPGTSVTLTVAAKGGTVLQASLHHLLLASGL